MFIKTHLKKLEGGTLMNMSPEPMHKNLYIQGPYIQGNDSEISEII